MKKVLGILILLLTLVVAAVYVSLNEWVRRGIERAATRATGVHASLDSARLGLVSGELDLGQLQLANPKGYEAPFFLRMEAFNVAVNPRSLLGSTVRVPRLAIAGAAIDLERQGTSTNFGAILQHMKQLGGTGRAKSEEKRYIVDQLNIKGVEVQATYAKARTVRLAIPAIVMRDVGSETGGVTLSQLATLVVQSVLAEVQKNATLPAEMQQQLTSELEGLLLKGGVPGDLEQNARGRAQKFMEREKKRLFAQ